MNPFLEEADEELKRIDHLIYVSLKYTRTVDILRSIIERLINTYDFGVLALLTSLKEKGHYSILPKSPGLRANMVNDFYADEPVMKEVIRHYHLLRNLSRADFKRSCEFRRHVKMTCILDVGVVEVDIDSISEYYRESRIFVEVCKRVDEQLLASKDGKPKLDMPAMRASVIAELDFNHR
jgi:hypothetical protein